MIEWACPECGSRKVEEIVSNAIVTTPITFSLGNRFEYEITECIVEIKEDGDTVYRCAECKRYTQDFGHDIWVWAEENNVILR